MPSKLVKAIAFLCLIVNILSGTMLMILYLGFKKFNKLDF